MFCVLESGERQWRCSLPGVKLFFVFILLLFLVYFSLFTLGIISCNIQLS